MYYTSQYETRLPTIPSHRPSKPEPLRVTQGTKKEQPSQADSFYLPFYALMFTSVQSSHGSGIKDNNVTVPRFLVALKSPTGYN